MKEKSLFTLTTSAVLVLLLVTSVLLLACAKEAPPTAPAAPTVITPAPTTPAPTAPVTIVPTIPTPTKPAPTPAVQVTKWKVQTEWPGVTYDSILAKETYDRIRFLSGGRLDATVHYGGELVPAYEVWKAIQHGILQAGTLNCTQWVPALGTAATLFGSSGSPGSPGMYPMLAWYYAGDGFKVANEVFGEWGVLVGVFPFTSELFCHSNKKLLSAADLKGLKFRTFGPWAEVMGTAFGAAVVTVPGGEIYTAMKTGIIDAFEYGGPALNWPMGFHEVAKYIGAPGVHSPGGTGFSCFANKDAWKALPEDLKQLVSEVFQATAMKVAVYRVYEDAKAMEKYKQYGTELFILPEDFQRQIIAAAKDYYMKKYKEDKQFAKIWDARDAFVKVYAQGSVVDTPFIVTIP